MACRADSCGHHNSGCGRCHCSAASAGATAAAQNPHLGTGQRCGAYRPVRPDRRFRNAAQDVCLVSIPGSKTFWMLASEPLGTHLCAQIWHLFSHLGCWCAWRQAGVCIDIDICMHQVCDSTKCNMMLQNVTAHHENCCENSILEVSTCMH